MMTRLLLGRVTPAMRAIAIDAKLALTLLMLRVLLADDADAPLAADHGAVAADFLDGRADFHVALFRRALETVEDPSFGQVVRGHLDLDAVSGQQPDSIHAHLAREVGENHMSAFKLDLEVRGREKFFDDADGLDEVLPRSSCTVIRHSARQGLSESDR